MFRGATKNVFSAVNAVMISIWPARDAEQSLPDDFIF
jgi:hypothetical protein